MVGDTINPRFFFASYFTELVSETFTTAENITLVAGDITTAKVDAIVNAANPAMLGGGGVDGAIHRAAGPQLLELCKAVKSVNGVRCPIGEARITGAGNLDARYVIHAVGPRYGIDPHPETLLASAYRNVLDLALRHRCRRIAFPAISCGVYHYPLEQAAQVAFSVCREAPYGDLSISFYLFGAEINQIWRSVLVSNETLSGAEIKD